MIKDSSSTYCPVCGYNIGVKPWSDGIASGTICSSCGVQFGFDDKSSNTPEKMANKYRELRKKWVDGGMKWWSRRPRPNNWNPSEQLQNVPLAYK